MKLLAIILVINLLLFSFLINISILSTSKYFYFKTFEKTKIFSSNENDLKMTLNTIEYFKGKSHLNSEYFSNQAILHMHDVKQLFSIARILSVLCLFTTVILVFFLKKRRYKNIKFFLGSSILVLLFFFLGMPPVFTNFEYSFLKFHHLFFRNDLWLFAPQDNLVILFNENFFLQMFKTLIINATITFFALVTLIVLIFKNDKSNS